MPIIKCYVDDETMKRLNHAAERFGVGSDEIAESWISESALNYAKDNGGELLQKMNMSNNYE